VTQPADPAVWWLRMAIGDLAAARAVLAADRAPDRGAAYLAQQSAEKAIKAAIVATGFDPPRIHDLNRLAFALPLFDGWASPPDLTRLTAAVVGARYPDPDEPAYEPDEVELLVADAAAVIDAVRAYLGAAGTDVSDLEAI
jgi:HEPN domain-containing protein